MNEVSGRSLRDGLSQQAAEPEVSALRASIPSAWATFEAMMREDEDYAWSWHCNLAVPIMDSIGASHEDANVAAAALLSHLFGCDITTHPHYEYEKSGAQAYAELRIAAEREEDASGIEARSDETPGEVAQPGGQEPGPSGDAHD